MFIRVNIPPWGTSEIGNGLRSLATVGRGTKFRSRLQAELEDAVTGAQVVLTGSARQAIALAVRSLGLSGRRMAVPGYVCPSVVTALHSEDVRIVPVDCEPRSVRFDPESLKRTVVSGGVDGILAANTYGLDQDYQFLASLGVPVIEDAAYQAGLIGADGRPCGLRSDAGVWSFNFKALTGIGGGVLLWSRADGLAERDRTSGPIAHDAVRFGNYALRAVLRWRIPRALPGGRVPQPEGGVRRSLAAMGNDLMTETQAAVALAQVRRRAELRAVQAAVMERVRAAAEDLRAFEILEPETPAERVHVLPLAAAGRPPVASKAALALRRTLHGLGLQTEPGYPVILGDASLLPQAHDLACRLVLVPAAAALSRPATRRVAEALRAAARLVA